MISCVPQGSQTNVQNAVEQLYQKVFFENGLDEENENGLDEETNNFLKDRIKKNLRMVLCDLVCLKNGG